MGKKAKKNKQRKNYSQLNSNDSSPQSKGGKRKSKRVNGQKKKENAYMEADDHQFRQSVEEGGTRSIIEVSADGNCLFRSISDQLYNDYGNMHDQVRNSVCDYIEANEDEFAVFLVLDETEEDEDAANFEEYCHGMREDGAWGGNVELVAAARLYRRNITVFSDVAAFTIEHGKRKSSGPDMLLSYHDGDHYNSVRDNTRSPTLISSKQSQKGDFEQDDETMSEESNDANENQTAKCSSSADDSSSINGNANSRKKSKTRSLKPSDQCACGSGQRYRKCCLAAEKRKEKLRKWKEKNGIEEQESDETSEESFADGKLKVLSI